MKKLRLILILSLGIQSLILAQDKAKFSVEISSDSILMGNYFQVKFSLENAQTNNFVAPDFEGFKVVSGPNMTSSFSMINGEVSQSMTYTYYLEPVDIGNYYIAPASVEVEDQFIETTPMEIIVVPNPDGIQQPTPKMERGHSFERFNFPQVPMEKMEPEAAPKKKKKKKRKTYKI